MLFEDFRVGRAARKAQLIVARIGNAGYRVCDSFRAEVVDLLSARDILDLACACGGSPVQF
jgi:hypothetical protein